MVKLTPGEEWFEGQRYIWEAVVEPIFRDREFCRALEIGTWEGGSACWILEKLCGGKDKRNQLVCIDHFDLMKTEEGRARWETFQENIISTGLAEKVRVIPEFSTPALFKLMNEIVGREEMGFNLVYVDGSHRADDTLLDAEMAWRTSSEGCILIFDDYEWDQAVEGTIEHPMSGIDAFLTAHNAEYSLLSKGYQIIIRKEVPLRLGFSPSHNSIM